MRHATSSSLAIFLSAGLLSVGLLSAGPLCAQDRRPPPEPRFYKGREIAQTMHYFGARWLVRESREREEECSTLLRELRIRPGDVVCDLGCGNGFYTLPIAERVGVKGKVLAVDIQQQMLGMLRLRARKAGLAERIETILCTEADPKLPRAGVDLVLMVDVYHELSHPEEVLRALHTCLAPGGQIVLAEFRAEDPKIPIKPLHKMSKRQILRELVPNGFRLEREFDALPWQHLLFFGRREDSELRASAAAGLQRATRFLRSIAVGGGYAGIYSADLKRRYGEALYEKATRQEIWVQPPGTPSVGQVFLDAFVATGADEYLAAARAAGLALAWAQREGGGWDHRADVSGCDPSVDVRAHPPRRRKGRGTFDDNISQGALTFLIQLEEQVQEPWLRDSIERGLAFLLRAQREDGAWPQWYPLRGGYHDHATFNDGAINDCIRVALLAHQRYGRADCLAAARRGGNFIAASQLAAPQAGWAQQYDEDNKPAKARAFEPAALCTAVTARNVATLRRLHRYTGDAEFLAPIPAALAWLRKVRGEDGRWARFYELGSDRPVFGDRDGRVYYRVEEISEERRKGYAWFGSWGASALRAGPRRAAGPRRPAPERVRRLLQALDAKGRWMRDGRIHVADFVRNAGLLIGAIR